MTAVRRRHWLALGTVVLSAWVALSSAAAAQTPQQLVEDTTNQMLARLKADRAELKAHPDRLYDLVNDIVVPHFDFVHMSHWVLGRRYWGEASNDEKARFVAAFRELLVRTYATALMQYTDQKVDFLPLRDDPASGHVTVHTQVLQSGAPPVAIDYSLYLRNGEWKVYDVAVDGISLLSNYRSSFNDEIRETGLAQLIARLEAHNQEKSQK